jgi:hypothetical protein
VGVKTHGPTKKDLVHLLDFVGNTLFANEARERRDYLLGQAFIKGFAATNAVEVQMEPTSRAHYSIGVFETAGQESFGSRYQIQLTKYENQCARYRISW